MRAWPDALGDPAAKAALNGIGDSVEAAFSDPVTTLGLPWPD